MLSDRTICEGIANDALTISDAGDRSDQFKAAFFEDEPLLRKIYSAKEVEEVYKAKAKVMVEMDLFDEDEKIRPPANPQEAARSAHKVLTELIDGSDVDIKKILKHMGIPNYPVTERSQLKTLLAMSGQWL